MGATAYLVLAGIILASGASFFFALTESALFALGKWKTRQLAERNREKGAILTRLLEQPSELLATIVLGNTVANASIVALIFWPALEGLWPNYVSFLAALSWILVGCEVFPKALAVRAPEQWALRLARPILLLQGSTGWLQHLVQQFNNKLLSLVVPRTSRSSANPTDEEYQELLEMAYQQGTLAKSEKEIILQIISLDRKTAKDVMKSLSQMNAISDALSVEDMLTAARQIKHRRIPVYDETPDTIVGILDAQRLLLDPHVDLSEAIDFPSFVPETMNLLQLLKSLERQHRGLAIVMDEYGGTAGLVTIEDILQEVVGEIRGDTEATGFVMEKLGPGRWRVNGTMRLEDFRREYPGLGEVDEVDTMGGLMMYLAEVVPMPGQSVQFRGLRLTAQSADERHVRELLVEVSRKK
ncbi:MAG TPA: hemolysin family protein [Verrucomicrobiae bacterium]|jgi:CBS domain containing-hemolysin-like protein